MRRARKREYPALENMKFLTIFGGHFGPPGFGSSRPKSMRIRIRNTATILTNKMPCCTKLLFLQSEFLKRAVSKG
jgi:hypothetical protein